MSLPEVQDRQDGFGGGLNTTSDDAALKPNECREAKNTRLSTRGAAEKRAGTQRVLASPLGAAVRGGFSWKRTASVQELVVSGGKLWTGALTIPMTLTDRGGTLSTTVPPTFAPFKGPTSEGVYIADGGPLNFWDGVTFTENIADTPSVEAVVSWGPRLFAVKDDTLYWSSTTGGINGHTLGALAGGGQAIVRTYGGQELITAAPLKQSLLLFHRAAISRFTGATTDDINIEAGTQGIAGDVGTVGKRSVVGVENAVYFLSDRGVFAATEMAVQPVSSPLERTLADLTKSDWAQVSAVHARAFNEVRWMIPGVGVYVYNYRTQGWSGPWDTAYATTTAMWDTLDDAGRNVVLIGRNDGHVLWCDRASRWVDDVDTAGSGGDEYTWRIKARRLFGGDYTSYKSWRMAYVYGEFFDPGNTLCEVTSRGSTVTVSLACPCAQAPSLSLAWDDPSTVWDDPTTVWSNDAATSAERGRFPLHGVNPWTDVAMEYTGDRPIRLSILDAVGFARNRR
jgi:hypothetical protein